MGVCFDLNLIFRKKGQNKIEEESKLVEKLVLCSKEGDWNEVWSILGTKEHPENGHLLNAIPQSRRWGVLHQAVYWNIPEVLQKVLEYPSCDPALKAKKCMSECGPTSRMTALQIAKEYKYQNITSILSNHISTGITGQFFPTFQPFDGYCDNKGLSLMSLTLSSYKKGFHPKPVETKKSVLSVLSDVFNDINSSEERWKKVQEIVADAVYPVSVEKATDIVRCQTKEEFYSQVIRTYSNEDNTIYAYLNMAFRRQRQENYRPTGDDLAMGPYCVMYQMLLLFWRRLKQESRTTYRKMKMTTNDVEKYAPGTRFIWQSIVSSAINPEHTHTFPSMAPTGDTSVLFTISNDADSLWKPRNIEEHADFPETERTYPAGAKFLVPDRSEADGTVHISLQLQ